MQEYKQALAFGKTNKDVNSNNEKVVLELDWLALGVAVKYQLLLDNSPQSILMWKCIRHLVHIEEH